MRYNIWFIFCSRSKSFCDGEDDKQFIRGEFPGKPPDKQFISAAPDKYFCQLCSNSQSECVCQLDQYNKHFSWTLVGRLNLLFSAKQKINRIVSTGYDIRI